MTMQTPVDQLQQLLHAIMHRRGLPTMRRRIKSEMPDVPLKDEVWPKFLRDNARRVLKLED